MAKRKIRVGVIFGGQSGEHEVSIVSAVSVISALGRKKYDVFPIGITKAGKWITGKNVVNILRDQSVKKFPIMEKIIIPDPTKKSLVPIATQNARICLRETSLDVVFPVLHGPYGEDGTIQGLLELSGIPYVGAGVLGSAVGMDKVIMKKIFKEEQLPIVKFCNFIRNDWKKNPTRITKDITKKVNFPVFVKPSNLGSSVGISKAKNEKQLVIAIKEALKYDHRVIVEEAVESAREIEVSVLGNNDPQASLPGEVIASNEFYDYDAKYVDGKSKIIIPAKLSKKIIRQVQLIAIQAFKATDCAGMARVDFLLDQNKKKLYLSEINTIPGFTSISMYPKLWEATGISYSELLDRLIALAIERKRAKNQSLTSYQLRKDWYKTKGAICLGEKKQKTLGVFGNTKSK
ncbi:MAG: D-alanine--D-alanine ligase [Candidatus Kerfeldbacteria bacterium CG08_land_8_20_14_0_20_40_16]|uniref:D-alanine--D-alanine ligase n=1 Tax=Candidatus Kerfeldbacteria bacterium CG08_land_8_20_14_0_20_40_16 TaxID=2014244 RepID=A0A2H0YUW2_9BACT|nr:MAG: D-alanine--D-alanine ligase [Candidatus Kerfeldbacteria bacterium CG08_land_8_20_14_0_20_40_16]